MSKLEGVDQVLENGRIWQQGVLRKAKTTMEVMGVEMQNHSKNTAPWTDRTGNARRSINSQTLEDSQGISTSLGIGMEYGVFLELAHGGRFRTVTPTVDSFRGDFLARIARGVQ